MEKDKRNEDILLEVRNLRVDFRVGDGKTVTAVRDVNFTLGRGRVLGIVGESGCGKSVTANTIMKLLPRESGIIAGGQILFEGRDIVTMSEAEMRDIRGRHIGMIFQEPMTSLNPVYRIEKQMTEMLLAHAKLSAAECHERCLEMLKAVGIPEPERRLREYPHQLSGGMRQRVMIAMVLSVQPELIIADEPTTALDVTIQAQIMELMGELREKFGTSIILITHDMGVIADVADEVLVMYGGNAIEHARVVDIFDRQLHPYTRGLLASIPRMDRDVETLETIEGTVPPLDEMPAGCHFSTRCPFFTEQCVSENPPLRDLGGRRVACWHPLTE